MARNTTVIPKRAITQLEKFKASLADFSKETGEEFPTLYEDALTMIEVRNPRIVGDRLLWEDEDGAEQYSNLFREFDEEDGTVVVEFDWWEWDEGLKYWKACLKRARRYWAMDTERLDAIQEGEAEDEDEED